MAKLKTADFLNHLQEICNWSGAKIALLYLSEAHANETWPLSVHAPPAHGSTVERLQAARQLLSQHPQFASMLENRIYADSLDNALAVGYGLWPERYMLLDGNVVGWTSSLSFEARCANLPQELAAAAVTLWSPQDR